MQKTKIVSQAEVNEFVKLTKRLIQLNDEAEDYRSKIKEIETKRLESEKQAIKLANICNLSFPLAIAFIDEEDKESKMLFAESPIEAVIRDSSNYEQNEVTDKEFFDRLVQGVEAPDKNAIFDGWQQNSTSTPTWHTVEGTQIHYEEIE